MVDVKIRKLHEDVEIPTYATAGAAGFDLVAVEDVIIAPGETKKIPLGLAFEIPEGYVIYVCMRSGIALNTKLRQPNGIGVIDSDYRGEVSMMFDNTSSNENRWYRDYYCVKGLDGLTHQADGRKYPEGTYIICKGDRVAQGILAPVSQVRFSVVDTLSDTERGTGGFGSTGTKAEANEI